MAYGFIRKVFEVFESYKTPIDMITTSEVSISVTIDNTESLDQIINELKKYGEVETDKDLSIICIVGHFISESKGYAHAIFKTLKNLDVKVSVLARGIPVGDQLEYTDEVTLARSIQNRRPYESNLSNH